MDKNLLKQLNHDFDTDIEYLDVMEGVFTLNESSEGFLTYNNHPLAINLLGNHLLVRSSNKDLLNELKANFSDNEAAWFMEFKNIKKLEAILAKYKMHINNMAPILVPVKYFKKYESAYEFIRIKKEDYKNYKSVTNFAFSFADGYPADKLAMAYYDDEKLVSIAGANQNSKYFWEIGVERLDYDKKYDGITEILLNNLVYTAREENPEITIIYSTQFSHVKSMNLAMRAGFEFTFSFINADYD